MGGSEFKTNPIVSSYAERKSTLERGPQVLGMKTRIKRILTENFNKKSEFVLNFSRQVVNIFSEILLVNYFI